MASIYLIPAITPTQSRDTNSNVSIRESYALKAQTLSRESCHLGVVGIRPQNMPVNFEHGQNLTIETVSQKNCMRDIGRNWDGLWLRHIVRKFLTCHIFSDGEQLHDRAQEDMHLAGLRGSEIWLVLITLVQPLEGRGGSRDKTPPILLEPSYC